MPPGDLLKEEMILNNLSVRIMAKIARVTEDEMQAILDGEGEITPRVAQGLSSIGVTPQFWLNFERIYREGLKKGKTVIRDDSLG